METIKELLKDYYPTKENNPGWPESFWETVLGPKQLASKLRKDLKNNLNLKTLDEVFSAYKLNYTPDDAVYLLNGMGIMNINDINEWLFVNNKYNFDFFIKTITHTPTLDIPLYQISREKLEKVILDNFPNLTPSDISWKDNIYKITTIEGLKTLYEFNPSDGYKWIKESRDCDDIDRISRAWLSIENLGNMAISDCEINCYHDNKIKYAHNIELAVILDADNKDATKSIRFCEPQNDKIWKLTDKFYDFTIDKIEPRKLSF